MIVDQTTIQLILVPAGAEYRSVQRSVQQVQDGPQVVAIPAGPQGVKRFLQTWEEQDLVQSGGVLLVGLGGSLSPEYDVGDAVLLEQVYEAGSWQVYGCDRTLTNQLSEQLEIPTGVGVSCDRVITIAVEKKQLHEHYNANVVDMESTTLLKGWPDCKIVILRVISDNCHHNLPDISNAIDPNGSIKPVHLALSFLKRPIAALRLIRGSLKGLKCLEDMAQALFK